MKRIIMILFAIASLILNIAMGAELISLHQNRAEDEITSVKFVEGNFRGAFDGSYADSEYNKALRYDVIPDQETAVRVAQAVYDGMKSNHTGWVPHFVMYDPEKEVWFVQFDRKNAGVKLDGGCSVAIQKSDGKIVGVWPGE